MEQKMFKPSAYKSITERTCNVVYITLILTIYYRSPRKDPCGTPNVTRYIIITLSFLVVRKEWRKYKKSAVPKSQYSIVFNAKFRSQKPHLLSDIDGIIISV